VEVNPVRIGKLDRRITIQRRTVTQDNSGEPTETWTTLSLRRPASIAPLTGSERLIGETIVAKEQVEFRTRWSTAIADLSPLDRIIYPSSDSPDDSHIYDIIQASEIGRREMMLIIAIREADL
jgi:SPP1 family predicted phage head-tail adaptor